MSRRLEIANKLRPCYIHNRKGPDIKALFHCWAGEKGIVEMEGGQVMVVTDPTCIQFTDNQFVEYTWGIKIQVILGRKGYVRA